MVTRLSKINIKLPDEVVLQCWDNIIMQLCAVGACNFNDRHMFFKANAAQHHLPSLQTELIVLNGGNVLLTLIT